MKRVLFAATLIGTSVFSSFGNAGQISILNCRDIHPKTAIDLIQIKLNKVIEPTGSYDLYGLKGDVRIKVKEEALPLYSLKRSEFLYQKVAISQESSAFGNALMGRWVRTGSAAEASHFNLIPQVDRKKRFSGLYRGTLFASEIGEIGYEIESLVCDLTLGEGSN